jgi:hypothetical protein
VLLIADLQDVALGVDEINRKEVVAGETVLAGKEAEPAAERQTGNTNAWAGPGGERVTAIPETTVEIAQSDSRPDDRFAALAVDVDSVQSAQVDEQSIVDHRERLVAMPAGASAQRHVLLARPTNGVLHIPRVVTDDDGGRKAREASIEVQSRFPVVRILRPDDPAGQFGGRRNRRRGESSCRPHRLRHGPGESNTSRAD